MAHIALATAGIVLPPLLKVFFERMASHEFNDFFRERKLSDKLLRKLKIALLTVNAVLEDAEDRQFTETSVKDWLDELKGTLYDIEDILDEIATKDFRRTITSKVRHSISASHFVNKIEGEINVAFEILEDLAKQIGVLGLRAGVGGQPLERLPTTSFVEESGIFGRHEDEEAIINSLFSNEASGSEIGVIVIVGMGGIGKTTLAQLVYNDNRVKEHFDLKAWVCVSDPFDVFMVMKTIIEEIGLSTNADSTNLNHLQINLKKMLTGKRFLFVLDDVWDKNNAKWEVLSNALKSGIQGSRVIVTTRDQDVARVVHASATHCITELPKEDCWSLFVKYAFHDGHPDAYPKLEAIGRQIVEKCKGLPLAIKAIGSLLWSKLDVDEWDNVFRSELWDLSVEETGILPALKLSYKYLSSHLKRCFAYCSIFPKDYTFKKEKLVLLWMAEGLLPQPKNKTIEEVGDEYFLALVSRSLFQRSSRNKYIMHDLVSDLAKFISKQFALSLEDDYSHEVRSRTRHFSYYCEKVHLMNFKTFHEAKRLRTILELNFFRNGLFIRRGVQFLLPMRRCLRVLILCYHADIAKLPDSIGKLIHLRYLDLSYTGIERLPDSLCKLCNLQILNLSHCRFLAALPRDTHKLINLRHLNFAETCIKEMPTNLGKLKCLQTLTKFIVGKIDSGSSIGELQTLTNLRGSLSIFGLQNVECPADAKDKNMRDMKYLVELVLEWKLGTNASESHIIVLDSLQPHSNLKSLTINQYGGKSFPNWVGHASFSNIASLRLEYCKFCCSLPPLGQLPSLQDLSIVGLDGVVSIGREFYGSGSSSIKPFVALKFVRFEKMLKWEEWFSFDAENEGGAFPNS
ncbi:putative disease resistance RPP13-like protein 1 [Corylus avellana]|nr:putative disease resistance RPP13-like protein 1 [Corylus avellana]